jgi:outer membrane autotransporter protein
MLSLRQPLLFPRLAPLALALGCVAAHAQATRDAPPVAATAVPCPDDRREHCPPPEEEDRPVRNNDAAVPQVVGDAPLPAAGGVGTPAPDLRFERGPLKSRSIGFSLAFDHALSAQWSLGMLGNVAKGRIQRSQTEFATTAGLTTVIPSDTRVDTRSTSLAVSLSHFTRDAVAFDGAFSVMRTQLDTRRVSNGTDEFTGENVSRSYGLWLSASRLYRFGARALVPQLGLEFVDTRTDPLVATFRDLSDPATTGPGFTVAEHTQRTLASLLSLQLQQPVSTGFGTLTPYARVTWRQRLWKKGDGISSVNANGFVRELDPDSAESRGSIGLAGGLIAQFTRGVSSFVDVSYRRGTNDLRETRLGLGLKFEI